jgi:phage terminase large subunit-like protein
MATKKTTKKKTAKKPLVNNKVKEEFKVEGKKVVSKIKALIKEGNVRKITVKDSKGSVILSLPVTAGVIGAVLLPPLIIVGALAALLTECTITVQRTK